MITFTRFTDSATRAEKLRIEDAQPDEWIVGDIMRDIARGTPWTKLDGRVLTIWDDYGHRYIYRITDYEGLTDRYRLEWPD